MKVLPSEPGPAKPNWPPAGVVNVAETSLTIDGVQVVIDSGLARIARHSPWTGLPSLQIEPVSRASWPAASCVVTVSSPHQLTTRAGTAAASARHTPTASW